MRVAFLATHFLNPDNVESWSGLPFFMKRALEDAGVECVVLIPEETEASRRWANFVYWRCLHGKRFLRQSDARLLQAYARQCERRLIALSVDAVFSPSTWPLAFLETELPVVLWTDACFAGLLDFYESFGNLAPPSVRDGHAAEQRALLRCNRVIYSSQWAARTAYHHYRLPPAKTDVIPFGPNLPDPPSAKEAAALARQRDPSGCALLFVGVDWRRKGVTIAIETAVALRAAGVAASLTIVGCRPSQPQRLPPYVEVIPFLAKGSAADCQLMRELYGRSHFLILPSRADASPVAVSEACAHGVPCLVTDVGGLPDLVHPGINGCLFPIEAGGAEYAAHILSVLRDPPAYRKLALRTASDAASRLSWKTSGRRVAALLTETVRETVSASVPA